MWAARGDTRILTKKMEQYQKKKKHKKKKQKRRKKKEFSTFRPLPV